MAVTVCRLEPVDYAGMLVEVAAGSSALKKRSWLWALLDHIEH